MARKWDFTNEQVEAMRAMLAGGSSYRDVADTFGCHHSSVKRRIPGYGWTYKQAGEFRAAVRAIEQEADDAARIRIRH